MAQFQQRPGFDELGRREFALQSSPRGRESRMAFDVGVEGIWTPGITFAVPGDLNAVYSTQVGRYLKIRNEVRVSFGLDTSTFTHTTASGTFFITDLPFISGSPEGGVALTLGSLTFFEGITKANYTQFAPRIIVATRNIDVLCSAQGQAPLLLTAADMPTGGNFRIYGAVIYSISN